MLNQIEIGGQLVPRQSFEAMAEISSNKTLMVQKLTAKPAKPEPIKGLKTLNDVFDHFKPSVQVNFEDESGASKKEELHFNNLLDFKKDGIINQSDFLSELSNKQDMSFAMIKKLKKNKILNAALKNPEAKQNMLNAIQGLIDEIDQAK